MGHRAAPYVVKIHKPGEPDRFQRFTDYDGTGVWMGKAIAEALKSFSITPNNDDDLKHAVKFERAMKGKANELVGATYLSSHLPGRHVIHDKDGRIAHRVADDDTRADRLGVLFQLPPGATTGKMIMHVRDSRSIKAGLHTHLRQKVRELTDIIVEIEAAANQAALRKALKQAHLKRVRLIKHAPAAADKFEQAVRVYGGPEEVGSIELVVRSKRKKSLLRESIESFLDDPDDKEVWQNLISFQRLSFDDVKVVVPHPTTGRDKVWTLTSASGGHPVQEDLDVRDDDDLGASAAAIEKALKDVL